MTYTLVCSKCGHRETIDTSALREGQKQEISLSCPMCGAPLTREVSWPNGVIEHITLETTPDLIQRQVWTYASVAVELAENLTQGKEKTVRISIDGREITDLHPAHLGALIRVLSVGSVQHYEVSEQAEDWTDEE